MYKRQLTGFFQLLSSGLIRHALPGYGKTGQLQRHGSVFSSPARIASKMRRKPSRGAMVRKPFWEAFQGAFRVYTIAALANGLFNGLATGLFGDKDKEDANLQKYSNGHL